MSYVEKKCKREEKHAFNFHDKGLYFGWYIDAYGCMSTCRSTNLVSKFGEKYEGVNFKVSQRGEFVPKSFTPLKKIRYQTKFSLLRGVGGGEIPLTPKKLGLKIEERWSRD